MSEFKKPIILGHGKRVSRIGFPETAPFRQAEEELRQASSTATIESARAFASKVEARAKEIEKE